MVQPLDIYTSIFTPSILITIIFTLCVGLLFFRIIVKAIEIVLSSLLEIVSPGTLVTSTGKYLVKPELKSNINNLGGLGNYITKIIASGDYYLEVIDITGDSYKLDVRCVECIREGSGYTKSSVVVKLIGYLNPKKGKAVTYIYYLILGIATVKVQPSINTIEELKNKLYNFTVVFTQSTLSVTITMICYLTVIVLALLISDEVLKYIKMSKLKAKASVLDELSK